MATFATRKRDGLFRGAKGLPGFQYSGEPLAFLQIAPSDRSQRDRST